MVKRVLPLPPVWTTGYPGPGSLREGLIMAHSQPGSRTMTSSAGMVDPRGTFFPAKLALAFGMLKFLLGILMVVFGALSLVQQASLAHLGAGMWGGMIVLFSGVMGILASKRPDSTVYLLTFMCVSILSLAVTGLLLIFAATGLARDNNHPGEYFKDQDDNPLPSLGVVYVKRPAVILNAVLVLLGVVDSLVSLGSVAICVREACLCYNTGILSDHSGSDYVGVEGHVRKDRLINWLGQQRNIFYIPQQMRPAPTGTPGPLVPPPGTPFYPVPHSGSSSLPLGSFSSRGSLPYSTHSLSKEERRERRRERRRQRQEMQRPDVEKPYTGLDREMAEDFIEVAMEPGMSTMQRSKKTQL